MSSPIRPSSFQLAEKCLRAPYLSTKYREANAATKFGNAVDDQVTRGLRDGELVLADGEELLPEAGAILDWVAATFPRERWEYFVQRRVTLLDPETGEELTAGTPDFMALNRAQKFLCVVDWKKSGQWWAGHLAPPDENLQQLIYLVAASLELSRELGCVIETGQITLACFDERGVQPKTSQEIKQDRWWDIIARVKAQPMVDVAGPEPEATKGPHCDGCYARRHCSAYLLPEGADMPVALVPFAQPGELTTESALLALDWVEKAKAAIKQAKELVELVEGNIDAFTDTRGPVVRDGFQYGPVETKGKRMGATVGTLEKEGLTRLIRQGEPGITHDWRPVGSPVAVVPDATEPKTSKRTKKQPAATLVQKERS